MNAVIDVGGGLRGIYAAGVFDRFLDENIHFDLKIGVSAGSANVASFSARQKGRNYCFFRDYSQRKEYMSFSNYIKNGSYLNLDYVYSELTNSDGENPIDYEVLHNSEGEIFVVATDAETGKAHYFTKSDMSFDNYEILKASCALPIACKPVKINGREYFDGGLSDPLPLKKAFDEGADKIVLILTKPKLLVPESRRNANAARLIRKKYPHSAAALEESCREYNKSLEKAMKLEKEGKLLIISPDNCEGVQTLTKNKEKLDRLYKKGYSDAIKVADFLF